MSYPCPINTCNEPMYDNKWSKNKSCSLWSLSEESRYDYAMHIDDAKSAKYKALSQPITDENILRENALRIENVISSGRSFFTNSFFKEDRFIPDEKQNGFSFQFFFDDKEIYDGISIMFDEFEEQCVNLQSIKLATQSINNFEKAVNEFEEFNIGCKDNEKDFRKSLSPIQSILDEDYYEQKKIFYQTFDQFKNTFYYDQSSHINYINELMQFDQHKLKINLSQLNFLIVYITSAGGKTTLTKQSKIYLDIDEFISRHSVKFKIVEEYCQRNKNFSLMTNFFKSTFYDDINFLQGKVLLVNHPNQLPNQFRLGFNEMIIIPKKCNWHSRWFNENFFTLIGIEGKIKYYLHYNDYHKTIIQHFDYQIKFKDKYTFNITNRYFKSNLSTSK